MRALAPLVVIFNTHGVGTDSEGGTGGQGAHLNPLF